MLYKVISFLSGLVYKTLYLRKVRKARSLCHVSTFDIVSNVENPSVDDLFVVYAIGDETISLIRWKNYTSGGHYESTMDNIYEYEFSDIRDNFYRVIDQAVNPYSIIKHSNMAELQTYAMRISRAFGIECPLMGLYIDKRNKHIMLITTKVGGVSDGYSIVYDMTLARTAGITHSDQIMHIARIKDIMSSQVIRALSLEDIIQIYHGSWRREIISNISAIMFRAIRQSESKFDKFKIYAKDVTMLQKVQPETNTMDNSPSDTPVDTSGKRKVKI